MDAVGGIPRPVTIGRIEGNLLSGMTARDITITDSAGKPFIAVESIRASTRDVAAAQAHLDSNVTSSVRSSCSTARPAGSGTGSESFRETRHTSRRVTDGMGRLAPLHERERHRGPADRPHAVESERAILSPTARDSAERRAFGVKAVCSSSAWPAAFRKPCSSIR